MSLHTEIREQPEVLARLLDTQQETAREIARVIRERRPRFVYVAARGTSDNAARYAQYVLGCFHALPVALATPSLFSLFGRPPDLHESLVIGISQSGQSPDIVGVVEHGAAQGATTLAITNSPDSPLARAAGLVFETRAGAELAVAATKTYTSQLFAVAMISAALAESDQPRRDLAKVPTTVERALAAEDAVREVAGRFRSMDRCVVLGRGFHFATAHEWALKLKELGHVAAEPYSPADFQHGPIAILERRFPVLAAVSRGAAYDDTMALLNRVERDRDVQLLVVSEAPEALALGDAALPFDVLPEWLAPIAAIVPAQLFCLHLARSKGLDEEAPPGLTKVTRTW
jgi:glucosamine--fructose-6-phosphate aminotransferase (isomerizing)